MTSKERLIRLLILLYQESDQDHQLTTSEIADHFEHLGITTHRTTVKEDIDLLIRCGINIVVNKGSPSRYFFADSLFELPELKLLVDAVESSKFITAKKSECLVKKLMSMTSESNAKDLRRHLYTAGRIKPENEGIYYIVDALHKAINQGRQIEFLYYKYDANKDRVPKNGGAPLRISPYAMLYNEDKYYVLGFSAVHKKVISLRVDRMGTPTLLDIPCRHKPADFDPVDYTVNVFSMYDGYPETVKLLCENRLMNYVVDRFGEDVFTTFADDEHFIAQVEVAVSPTFYGWIFQFAGGVQLLGPLSVLESYQAMFQQNMP